MRAAEQAMSLSAYLRRELQAIAERRTVAEVLDEWQGERADLSTEQILEAVHGDGR